MPDPIEDYRQQLIELGKRMEQPDLPERINKELADGNAFIGAYTDKILCVLQHLKDDTLLIWVLVSKQPIDRLQHYLAFMQVAQGVGYKRLRFKTKRKAFRRIAPDYGFKETGIEAGFFIFEKEV